MLHWKPLIKPYWISNNVKNSFTIKDTQQTTAHENLVSKIISDHDVKKTYEKLANSFIYISNSGLAPDTTLFAVSSLVYMLDIRNTLHTKRKLITLLIFHVKFITILWFCPIDLLH